MKAVFLDRDGTLIVDPPDERVDTIAKIQLLPQTLAALKLLASLDFLVFIVTNQAGIAEGRINQDQFETINREVLKRLEPSGINVLKTYVCPHKPEDNCVCHKPNPFMILQAAKEFNVDLAQSYTIGDRESDILAGVNAGTKTILVQTGNTPVTSAEATYTAADLLEAVRYIASVPKTT
jgi:D-glycero-D-manno-heptose 1,7-bisphosphate phosphatase